MPDAPAIVKLETVETSASTAVEVGRFKLQDLNTSQMQREDTVHTLVLICLAGVLLVMTNVLSRTCTLHLAAGMMQ